MAPCLCLFPRQQVDTVNGLGFNDQLPQRHQRRCPFRGHVISDLQGGLRFLARRFHVNEVTGFQDHAIGLAVSRVIDSLDDPLHPSRSHYPRRRCESTLFRRPPLRVTRLKTGVLALAVFGGGRFRCDRGRFHVPGRFPARQPNPTSEVALEARARLGPFGMEHESLNAPLRALAEFLKDPAEFSGSRAHCFFHGVIGWWLSIRFLGVTAVGFPGAVLAALGFVMVASSGEGERHSVRTNESSVSDRITSGDIPFQSTIRAEWRKSISPV